MIQQMLKDFGYAIDVTGTYDETTTQVYHGVSKRHPPLHGLTGFADRPTLETLKRLRAGAWSGIVGAVASR